MDRVLDLGAPNDSGLMNDSQIDFNFKTPIYLLQLMIKDVHVLVL